MQTITAVIPAKNEEKNIERCITSVLWCDKVLVISTGTDGTAEIARGLGVNVIEKNKSDKDDFEEVQKNLNLAIKTCSTDWIFRVDADEVVTPELQEEIKDIIGQSQIKSDKIGKETDSIRLNPVSSDYIVAYGIPRQQNFLGTFLKGGDWAYDRLVRLFRPKFCRYDPIVKVHEQFKVNGKIGYLKSSLLHYSHPDKKTLFKKFDSYTTLEARELKETKLSAFFKLIFIPPYIFLRWMIYHHGYRDGLVGIQAGSMRAYYDFLLYSKYLKSNK
ncbi:MAG: Glycosyl transferase family 2 [Candidatus Levybacteria bacterium GW2011_GWA2_37_36]|nr:MAG: Glycosyl transferase family 2 [Candidatus Levybacteria bacterium GW2011_GWA2_37_36]